MVGRGCRDNVMFLTVHQHHPDTQQHDQCIQGYVTRLRYSTSGAPTVLLSVSMVLVCCEKVLTHKIGLDALGT